MPETTERKPWLCRIGLHMWRWINETLPHDMGERECQCCGKRQTVSMDTH